MKFSKRSLVAFLAIGGVALSSSLAFAAAPAQATDESQVSSATQNPRKQDLGRPSIQVLSQYRSGDKTHVKVASTVAVKGAAAYRLEMYDYDTGRWVFQRNCKVVCQRTYANADLDGTAVFRMRALDKSGAIRSKPSVSVGVTVKRWDKKSKPGATLTFNVGPISNLAVGTAIQDLMKGMEGACRFDTATRNALAAMVKAAEAATNTSKNPYLITAVGIAQIAEAFYTAVYQSRCDVIEAMARSLVSASATAANGGTSKFEITTRWVSNPVKFAWLDLPLEITTCNVDILPSSGVGLRIDTGSSKSGERTCLNMANTMWSVRP